ncbi:hypothetical protein FNF31_03115 [Cafeteria roenbergensis]|nr:hypothetical protein FNF31_03115 [Cafeteria roenbergensis]
MDQNTAMVLGPDAVSPTTRDVTTREGLGENLPYPSVDYLGVGYDLIRGNPDGDPETQLDPGFRNSVVELVWDQSNEHLSRDMRYLQPVGGFAFPEYSCHMSSSSRELSTESDYQSSLQVDASVQGGYGVGGFSGSFSASAGFGEFARDVASKGSERFELVSYCLQFVAGFNKGADTKLKQMPHFEAAVQGLVGGDQDTWNAFFEEFGTHYISKVHLGGKMIHQVTMDRSSVEKIRNSNVDVSLAVEASFGAGSGGSSASFSKNKEARDAMQSASAESRTLVLGGLPPTAGGKDDSAFGEWAASVREAPMPVRYELTPFYELATSMDKSTYDMMFKTYSDEQVKLAKKKQSQSSGPVSKLFPGDTLPAGKRLDPPGGKAYGLLEDDGSFRLKDRYDNVLWEAPVTTSSGTDGEKAELRYTTKGTFDIRRGQKTLFSAHTGMHKCHNNPPGRLELQMDGNLVVYSSNGKVMWMSGTDGGKMNSEGVRNNGFFGEGCKLPNPTEIKKGQSLRAGEKLVSGGASLELRNDGRISLFGNGRELWHNHLENQHNGPFTLTLQPDGNLVEYNKDHSAVWAANIHDCDKKGTVARLNGDGNFVVYEEYGEPVWSTDTGDFSTNRDDPLGDRESAC